MAGLITIVTRLLFLGVCAHHIIPTGSVVIPSPCCMFFVSKRIPENRVVSYQLTSRSTCLNAGVIFTTKKGQQFCGDPKQEWVQRYMKNLDAKQKKASPRARAVAVKGPAQRYPGNQTTL
ncbi:C-C motif chemokine 24 [Pongo abelii]|uniref:C-C motif chemokine ligand 24 n=1 Tax=Pongo abelii TaxID=9601 RepID=A0A6D2XXF3_PONAB|nr:C-C motif chemokine 24 [Pongo abelii]PNJ85472.1 CCL24 isoform 1 [Pongo abelii]PNJ85473.1 CCL24 isoform 2 [Pongo abelii]